MSWLLLLQILGLFAMGLSFISITMWLASDKTKRNMEEENSRIPFKDDDINGD